MAGLQQALCAEAGDEGTGASCARGSRLGNDAEIHVSSPVVLDRLHAAMLRGSEVGGLGRRPARASPYGSRYTD